MLKRLSIIAALVLLTVMKAAPDPQIGAPVGNPVTMTGSAIRLVPNPNVSAPIMCASILIEPLAGGSNVVYVLNAPPSITMTYNTAGTTTVAQLAAATMTAPGQAFTYPSNGTDATQQGGTDLRYWGLMGSASDQVLATCALKQ